VCAVSASDRFLSRADLELDVGCMYHEMGAVDKLDKEVCV